MCVCVCVDPSATCSRYFWLNNLGHVPKSPSSWRKPQLAVTSAVKTDQFVPFKPLFPHQLWQTVLLCRRCFWAVQRELEGVSELSVSEKWITKQASLKSWPLNWPNVGLCPVLKVIALSAAPVTIFKRPVCFSAHESQGLMNFITHDSLEPVGFMLISEGDVTGSGLFTAWNFNSVQCWFYLNNFTNVAKLINGDKICLRCKAVFRRQWCHYSPQLSSMLIQFSPITLLIWQS